MVLYKLKRHYKCHEIECPFCPNSIPILYNRSHSISTLVNVKLATAHFMRAERERVVQKNEYRKEGGIRYLFIIDSD